jgi:hypothetical protein
VRIADALEVKLSRLVTVAEQIESGQIKAAKLDLSLRR